MNTDAKIFTNNCEINPTYQKDQVEFIPQMQIGVTVYLKKKKKGAEKSCDKIRHPVIHCVCLQISKSKGLPPPGNRTRKSVQLQPHCVVT